MNVIAFTPARPEIPTRLRELADEIEAGEYGKVGAIAMVIQSGPELMLEGLGDADPVRSLGLFVAAQGIVTDGFGEVE